MNVSNWHSIHNYGEQPLTDLGISPWAQFTPIGSRSCSPYTFGCPEDYKRALLECAPLNAIILQCADAFSNGLFEVLNYSTQNYVRGQYKDWERLLENPNPFTNQIQFLQQLYIYKRVWGYCYAMPIYASGFGKDKPEMIFLLPPWCIDVELKDKTKPLYTYRKGESFRRVWFTLNGSRVELKEEDLILFTDNTAIPDECTLLPVSVIKPLASSISLFISSDEAALKLVKKGGPLGIITNNSADAISQIATPPEDMVNLQRDLQRNYGLSWEQWQYVISNQNLSFTPIGVNISELRLDENQAKAIKTMCFQLGYPFILSPFSDQSTYNNVVEAKKQLYQDTIIPQANAIIAQLNTGLKTHENNIDIKVTYEDVYVFQQSQKDKGDGRRSMNQALKIEWDNGIITRNMWLKELGRDEIKGNELFNKYKFELTPEELGAVQQNISNEQSQRK